jgi:hypothetical protein
VLCSHSILLFPPVSRGAGDLILFVDGGMHEKIRIPEEVSAGCLGVTRRNEVRKEGWWLMVTFSAETA